jgi:hypothetical protein
MQIAVQTLISNQFSTNLRALKGILKKAETHAKERNFDPNLFLELRVAPDMFPFVRQIQMTTDTAKGAVARLTGKTAPVFADNEKSWEELYTRIDNTINFITSCKPEDFQGYETRSISFPWRPGLALNGHDYLTSHAIPNFYFHATTAYALLRSAGVALGKNDFLGEQNWKTI